MIASYDNMIASYVELAEFIELTVSNKNSKSSLHKFKKRPPPSRLRLVAEASAILAPVSCLFAAEICTRLLRPAVVVVPNSGATTGSQTGQTTPLQRWLR